MSLKSFKNLQVSKKLKAGHKNLFQSLQVSKNLELALKPFSNYPPIKNLTLLVMVKCTYQLSSDGADVGVDVKLCLQPQLVREVGLLGTFLP